MLLCQPRLGEKRRGLRRIDLDGCFAERDRVVAFNAGGANAAARRIESMLDVCLCRPYPAAVDFARGPDSRFADAVARSGDDVERDDEVGIDSSGLAGERCAVTGRKKESIARPR